MYYKLAWKNSVFSLQQLENTIHMQGTYTEHILAKNQGSAFFCSLVPTTINSNITFVSLTAGKLERFHS